MPRPHDVEWAFRDAPDGHSKPMRRLWNEERGAVGWLLVGVVIGVILVIWAIFSLIF